MQVTHFYRAANLHTLPQLVEAAKNKGIVSHNSEWCYNVEHNGDLSTDDVQRLVYLLSETFEAHLFSTESFLKDSIVVEVGPRQQFTSAWSTNAVGICHAIGITSVTRVERSKRFAIKDFSVSEEEARGAFASLVHDRMTECPYPNGISTFQNDVKPEPWFEVDILGKGQEELERFSKANGLGFDAFDLKYYTELFMDLGRNPTNVECFDLAQGNSEHSRHWFFGGKLIIDDKEMPSTLFQLVKKPYKVNPNNSTIAFHDNSSAQRGFSFQQLCPRSEDASQAFQPAPFKVMEKNYDVTFTCETHNFPCGIAPFPCAETGTGGRLRDGESTGRGSIVAVGTAAYCVGNLNLPDYDCPWEDKTFEYPSNMASPQQILIEASNGASDYGNKFGEPLLCGFTRSFGQRMPNGDRIEWIKPIMMSGGLGMMDSAQVEKFAAEKGNVIVKLGGPAYRIGVGGGAASSMVAGDNAAELDFNAVQRGDAEMLQKVNRVIRACVELGSGNPIRSIHDQGAGGSGNVLKEISEPAGARIEINKMLIGDPSMSLLEKWIAEYQENNCLILDAKDITLFSKICEREKAPFAIVGTITGDGQIVVVEGDETEHAVNLPLDKVLADMPQKTFVDVRQPGFTGDVELPGVSVEAALDRVFRLVSVGSKRFLTNKVDRCVTGLVAQQQCVGPFHTPLANCAVISMGPLDKFGAVTSIGEAPTKGLSGLPEDLARMARLTVAEALTNMVWAKLDGDVASVKASGNWMWAAKLAGEGAKMYDTAQALSDVLIEIGMAIDGGKDSLSMAAKVPQTGETVKCPGEMVMSCYATVSDTTLTVTPDLKFHGDSTLLFVDLDTQGMLGKVPSLSGSALAQVYNKLGSGSPDVCVASLKAAFAAVQSCLPEHLIAAGHDRSDGGFVTAAIEMAIAGNVGLDINYAPAGASLSDQLKWLFAEGPGLFLEVHNSNLARVMELFRVAKAPQPLEVGVTRQGTGVSIKFMGEAAHASTLAELRDLWEATSFELEKKQCLPACVEQEREELKTRTGPKYELTYRPEMQTPATDAPLVAIIREEGSNSDREMGWSFHMAGFEAWDVTMSDLLEGRETLDRFRGVAFVGGFSYADVMDSAKGWASKIRFAPNVKKMFQDFYDRPDTFSLGVCNGCQLMALLGWVPGYVNGNEFLPQDRQPRFIHNESTRYECRFVSVKVEDSAATPVWFKDMVGSTLGVWVAHGEGRATFPDPEILDITRQRQQIPMRYVDDNNQPTQKYPYNPNGSTDAIVSLCSPCGRHLAMMPHPERTTLFPQQWAYSPYEWKVGEDKLDCSPWLRLFQNARQWCDTTQESAKRRKIE